jgi:Uma2 family endonuclease
MIIQEQRRLIPVEEFDSFVERPENADKLFELVGGEIFEVPSNAYASKIASVISFFIQLFLRDHGIAGHVTGEAGGYVVAGEKYAPDVAYISKERQPELAKEGYNPNAPDLAVEVDFPSSYTSQKKLNIKIANYLAAGTLLWMVYPETKEVNVYVPGQPVKILGINDTLDGGNVLSGFALAVREVFAE